MAELGTTNIYGNLNLHSGDINDAKNVYATTFNGNIDWSYVVGLQSRIDLKSASLVTSTIPTGITNSSTSNTNTYLNIVQGGSSVGSSTQISGAGSVTVSSDALGKLLITGTNTTYSAGTGVSLSGTTFGQTITTSGSGTYIQSITQTTNGFQVNLGTPPNSNTTYSAGTGISLSGTTFNLDIKKTFTGEYPITVDVSNVLYGVPGVTITGTGNVITAGSFKRTGGTSTQFLMADGSVDTFGTAAGTVAQGNDSRINNGQTAYGWGNHAGLYVKNDDSVNADATKNWTTTTQGISLFTNSTGSTNFPTVTGLNIDFSTGINSSSGYGRDFGIHKSQNLEKWYLRGYNGTTGDPLPWREIYHSGNFATGTTAQYIRGDGSLATFPSIPAGTVTSITAGNGLNFSTISSTGAITLGTPGSTTLSTVNSVTATSHTHDFTPGGTTAQYISGAGTLITFPAIPAGTVTSVTAGNGMTFTTISSSGTVTMGTPGTLTASTTSAVTSTSHTHAITTTADGTANTIVQTDGNGVTKGRGIAITSTSNTEGFGLGLYGGDAGSTSALPTYGMAFSGPPTFGGHGGIPSSDWAIYFTMSGASTRGWIFKNGSSGTTGNVASITAAGAATFNSTVTAPTFSGNLSGNATTATTLATSRTFDLTTGVTATGISFNGSANVSIPVTGINASYLNSGTVPDARMTGVYTGFTHRIDGVNTIFSTPSPGTNNSQGRTIYGLAEFRGAASATTGAIVFKSSFVRAAAIMKQIEINGMLYSTGDVVKIIISNYTSAITKRITVGTADIQVRVGTDPSGNFCIILGDVGTSWSYPHFVLSKAFFSHTGVSDSVAYGWTVGLETSLASYTAISAEYAPSPIVTDISGNATTATSATTATNVNRSVTGGNGMTGGGTLTANQVITLGTPGTITLASTNSVSTSSHTHNFLPGGTTAQYIRGDGSLATFPSIPAGTVTSITAGNGLNFSTISSTGAITLGTPGTLTASTTSAVTSTSHTHAITTTSAGAANTIVQTDSAGKITAVDFIGSSDEKLKEDIEVYPVRKLNTDYKTYKFKTDPKHKTRIGVVAQDLEIYHPEFVSVDENGMKSVSYIDLHSAEIAYLKDENYTLKNENDMLKKDMEGLKNQLYIIKKHLGI